MSKIVEVVCDTAEEYIDLALCLEKLSYHNKMLLNNNLNDNKTFSEQIQYLLTMAKEKTKQKKIYNVNKESIEIRTYDGHNNLVYCKKNDDYEFWCEYDKNNNLIHFKNNKDYEYWHEYNCLGMLTCRRDSTGFECWYNY